MQALVMTNIGHEAMRVHDVNDFDYYLGKNVTYNIQDLVNKGYVGKLKNKNDKRSTIVVLTKKGEKVLKILNSVNVSHQESLHKLKIDVNNLNEILVRLQRIF
jgi:DNA-binding MarR family transcriptional regulator